MEGCPAAHLRRADWHLIWPELVTEAMVQAGAEVGNG